MRCECGRSVSLFAKRPWAALGNIQVPRYSTASPAISSATDFKPPKRQQKERGFWQDELNHKRFLDAFGSETGITKVIFEFPNNSANSAKLSDWYSVSRRSVELNGGFQLFMHYPSLGEALKANYPDYPWDLSKFNGAGLQPPGYWREKKNLLRSLDKAEATMGITKIEDWYSVSLAQLKELGFPTKFSRVQLVELLQEKYPEHNWEKVYLFRGRLAQQKRLERAVSSLFAGVEMKTNVRKEAGLINPETGFFLEVDIFLPSLKLAFEYQDIHHYKGSEFAFEPLVAYKERDKKKVQLAKEREITLIVVPCWWDGKIESLLASIRMVRPELVASHNLPRWQQPIPDEAPPDFFAPFQKGMIEGIGGRITSACFLTQKEVDPTHWWIFEKYDGIRAIWHPTEKTFYSRYGNKLTLPQEVIDAMPADLFLDGEFWFGRDAFQDAARIAKRVSLSEIDWSRFRYMVFDVPNHKGTYQERYAVLEQRLGGHASKYLEVAPKEECKGVEHLEKAYQDIVDNRGEGVILRNPTTPYEYGRSRGYLKHKKFRDAEAQIVSIKDAYTYECKLPSGILFDAAPGTSEFVKRWNPKVGDIVSFRHRGFLLGSKKPNAPSLYRVRPELSWDDVLLNWKERLPSIPPPVAPMTRHERTKPKGYWLRIENRRKFFCEFAAERGFDPLVVENWQNIMKKELDAKQGGHSIFWHYPSLKKALHATFPELR